jgi:uncharacterized protein YsxB (DUF464 family)
MIEITITRTGSGQIREFEIKGHAFFAERGKDIVCAGVSAVSVGVINAIHALTGVIPEIKQENGLLRCVLPENLSDDIIEKVQILLEGMVISLQTIEEEYGKNLKITFKKREVK